MRYFIGLLVTLGLIILIIVLLLTGNSGPAKKQIDLPSYADSGVARLIIDGPITSEHTHNEVQIDISQSSASATLYQGYQQTVLNSKSYSNNIDAFTVFLHALVHENFTRGNSDKSLQDERGYCPFGDRYIFSLVDKNGNNVFRYWSTSCGGTHTYNGNTTATVDLFQKQIPDYGTLISNAQF